MRTHSSLRPAALAALAALVAAPAAQAQAASADAWQLESSLYVWVPGTYGDSQIGSLPKLHVKQTPAQALDRLDLGLMGSLEARKGRWGLMADAFHVRLSESGSATRLVAGVPVATVNAEVALRQTINALGTSYRLDPGMTGANTVDVLGGLRYMRIRMDAELTVAALGQLQTSSSPRYDKSWTEPYLGARITAPVAPQWTALAQGDVGGFGAGGDHSWQLHLGARYEWSRTLSSTIGYRWLHSKVDDDDFKAKLNLRGIQASLGYRF
jgi:opacity protein-like surface antigen